MRRDIINTCRYGECPSRSGAACCWCRPNIGLPTVSCLCPGSRRSKSIASIVDIDPTIRVGSDGLECIENQDGDGLRCCKCSIACLDIQVVNVVGTYVRRRFEVRCRNEGQDTGIGDRKLNRIGTPSDRVRDRRIDVDVCCHHGRDIGGRLVSGDVGLRISAVADDRGCIVRALDDDGYLG